MNTLNEVWLLKIVSNEFHNDKTIAHIKKLVEKIDYNQFEEVEELLRFLLSLELDNNLKRDLIYNMEIKSKIPFPFDHIFDDFYHNYMRINQSLQNINRLRETIQTSKKLVGFFEMVDENEPVDLNLCRDCHVNEAIPGTGGYCAECARRNGIRRI